MSRAFLNEDKFEQAGDELIERPISPHPNYVTANGIDLLQAEANRLEDIRAELASRKEDSFAKQKLAEIDRDLRYYHARLETAQLIARPEVETDQVLFGATVTVEDETGNEEYYTIVGEDEADVNAKKVSWVSPLAKALIGARLGDTVIWRRPAGNIQLGINKIEYI